MDIVELSELNVHLDTSCKSTGENSVCSEGDKVVYSDNGVSNQREGHGSRQSEQFSVFSEGQLEQRERNYKRAVSSWRNVSSKIQTLISDSTDVSVLRRERDILLYEMDCVSKSYYLLDESLSSIGKYGQAVESHDRVEKDHQELVKEVRVCIKDLELETLDRRSCLSLGSGKSVRSARSHMSNVSNGSKAEIAAEAAALKAELTYVNKETKLKAELEQKRKEYEKLQTEKKLNVAEAKLRAIEAIETAENQMLEPHRLPSRDINFVEDYCLTNIPRDEATNMVSVDQLNDSQNKVSFNTSNRVESTDLNVHAKEFVSAQIPEHMTTGKQSTEFMSTSPDKTTFDFQNRFSDQRQDIMMFAKCFAERLNFSRLPSPEPGIFSGDPLSYPGWKCGFETLIEHRGIPVNERIYFLKKYLGGVAKDAVEGYFLLTDNENAYVAAKNLLQERYGDPFLVADAFRTKLEAWPKIASRDSGALRKFADFLRQCILAMETIESLRILDDVRENLKLLNKLPEWMVLRWARIVAEWKERWCIFPPFSEFVSFVVKESNIACQAIMSTQVAKGRYYGTETKQGRYDPNTKRGVSTFSTESEEHDNRMKPIDAKKPSCLFCEKQHHLDNCSDFLSQTLSERKEYIISKKLCFACLSLGHRSKFCRQRRKCGTCMKRHPTSLHGDFPQNQKQNTEKHASVSHLNDTGNRSKCNMILPVWISHRDNPEREQLIYALLDTQSDTTFILDNTRDSLKLTGTSVKLSLSTMASENKLVDSERINGLIVRGYNSDVRINLPPTYSRGLMPANKSHIPTPEVARQWSHLERIADELLPLQDVEVGILIGYNCSRALAPRDIIPPIDNEPFGQRTDLGWGIVGIIDPDQSEHADDPIGVSHRILAEETSTLKGQSVFSARMSVKEVLDPFSIVKWMELDFCERQTESEVISQEDLAFLDVVSRGVRLLEDKHYELPLPFKQKSTKLPNNRYMAVQRLNQLRKRFRADDKYWKDYTEFMTKVIVDGHAEKVPDDEILKEDGSVWYIPHHGVYHPKKPNKIRVVFDCSAKYRGRSLNDELLQGPDLTNTLVGVLCRFRLEPIVVMCDIEQMFFSSRSKKRTKTFSEFCGGQMMTSRKTQ